jgi:hypothetical protein
MQVFQPIRTLLRATIMLVAKEITEWDKGEVTVIEVKMIEHRLQLATNKLFSAIIGSSSPH